MILYLDSENRIKDVNTTSDNTLIPLEVDDTDNPFKSWSVAKICCYKVYTSRVRVTPYPEPVIEVDEETGEEIEVIPEDVPEEEIEYKTVLSGYTPYVDSRLLEHIDMLGKDTETRKKETSENESAILDEAEVIDENNNAILDIAEIIENLEERISALEGRD